MNFGSRTGSNCSIINRGSIGVTRDDGACPAGKDYFKHGVNS
jgi:hypothetical protein